MEQEDKAIEVFAFGDHEVRVLRDAQGDPWWVAMDVCKVLGYTNHKKAIADHCLEKGVTKRYTASAGGAQETLCINEANLYRLILRSHMPNAERFSDWVCEEVLPAIRKTGHYEMPKRRYGFVPPRVGISPEIMIKEAMRIFAEDPEARKRIPDADNFRLLNNATREMAPLIERTMGYHPDDAKIDAVAWVIEIIARKKGYGEIDIFASPLADTDTGHHKTDTTDAAQ
ncbi:hypothetical protein A4U49_04310 [Acidithiobacillus ferrivorans]|uniref:BRO-N domain-containing protein n=1 Tax=Acidithiobacillus ferrivorans TaxID=160808 RepID=UPI000892C729|nr:BRO family protein [Acidithiobacillus ferrivorans]OFA17010.1 hypothetical protein A4U49_04310 [Acidithiobacillus ferrivorans]